MTAHNLDNWFEQPKGLNTDNVYHGEGTNIFGATTKDGLSKILGSLKIDTRPTGGSIADYAEQIRMISGKTSGSVWGLDNETHMGATGTASMRGIQGVSVLDATFTATNAIYVGTYGQVRADGTFTGSGFMAALYGIVEASTAITASHVCAAWLDTHQANAVTGSYQLLYMTENGATALDQVLYMRTPGAAAFAEFDTCTNFVFDTATTAGASKKIKITVNGATFYINAYAGA